MTNLGSIFSSAARTDILRVLWCQTGPLGLRQVARLAGVHPRSAELALEGLVVERRVAHRKTPRRSLYRLNRRHPEVSLLDAVFDASNQARWASGRSTLDRRGRSILPFVEEAGALLGHARKRIA